MRVWLYKRTLGILATNWSTGTTLRKRYGPVFLPHPVHVCVCISVCAYMHACVYTCAFVTWHNVKYVIGQFYI